MISYLNGTLAEKNPVQAFVECAGVGYEVNIPLSTFDRLPAPGKEIKLLIHYSFNESDGVRLFGFITPEERMLFRHLISISKIGPKIALAVLSGLSVQDFIQAVQMGDVGLIVTVPGIGKKSAERLIIELKDKVGSISVGQVIPLSQGVRPAIIQEAEAALMTLGYKQQEARKALGELVRENSFNSSEDIIKAAIKSLYRKRSV